jgi:magnesium chelatase family protein
MRQPMEERKVLVNRTRQSAEFPASFILVAAMNPCPCGYYGHATKACNCPPGAVIRYLNKISGPLLDRIDLQVEVIPVPYEQVTKEAICESSGQVRERVIAARERQRRRYERLGFYCNAQMANKTLRTWGKVDRAGQKLLRNAVDNLGFSMRAYDHILKISRTIADLAGSDHIFEEHLAEAIQFRSLDREGWGG